MLLPVVIAIIILLPCILSGLNYIPANVSLLFFFFITKAPSKKQKEKRMERMKIKLIQAAIYFTVLIFWCYPVKAMFSLLDLSMYLPIVAGLCTIIMLITRACAKESTISYKSFLLIAILHTALISCFAFYAIQNYVTEEWEELGILVATIAATNAASDNVSYCGSRIDIPSLLNPVSPEGSPERPQFERSGAPSPMETTDPTSGLDLSSKLNFAISLTAKVNHCIRNKPPGIRGYLSIYIQEDLEIEKNTVAHTFLMSLLKGRTEEENCPLIRRMTACSSIKEIPI